MANSSKSCQHNSFQRATACEMQGLCEWILIVPSSTLKIEFKFASPFQFTTSGVESNPGEQICQDRLYRKNADSVQANLRECVRALRNRARADALMWRWICKFARLPVSTKACRNKCACRQTKRTRGEGVLVQVHSECQDW